MTNTAPSGQSTPSSRPARRQAIALVLALLLGVFAFPSSGFAGDRPEAITYSTPGGVPQLSNETLARPTKRVLILNEGLSPSRVTLESGERIVWESYSGTATSIVFEREVAGSMICHGLVNFSLDEDELRSGEIHTGEKASFCELKPGHYRYRAVRANPLSGGRVGAAHRIDGWIVVRPPAPEGRDA
jgi:hypothetical protein